MIILRTHQFLLMGFLIYSYMKCCKKCNEFKSYNEFGKNKSKKDGVAIYCKKCNALKTLNSKKDNIYEIY